MATLRLHIDGETGKVPFRSFITLLDNSLAILRDLDSAISSDPAGTLDWVISELSLGSASVGIQSRSTKPPRDYGQDVVTRLVEGLEQIEQEGTTPPYFSDFDLRKAQGLAMLLGRDGAQVFRATDVELEKTAVVTRRTSVNAAQLMAPRHRAAGSVTGRLEMISVHKQPQFSVYHAVTNRAVKCKFRPEEMLDTVKDALGRRVIASGTIHYNHKGEPIRVELEHLQILPKEEELPSPEKILGMAPDFTGNSTTEEFLRRIRGA